MSEKSVLAALKEVIVSQQDASSVHEPTPNEYLAVISTTLKADISTNPEYVLEMLKILNSVMPNASKILSRRIFRQFSMVLVSIIKSCDISDSLQSRIANNSMCALGHLCKQQEYSDGVWQSLQGLQAINALLSFIEDENSYLRKSSQDALFDIMLAHKINGYHSICSYFGDYAINVLKSCNRFEYKRSLALVQFLEKSLALLPPAHIIDIFGIVMKLQSCEQAILTAAIFRMIDSLFQSPQFTPEIQEILTIVRYFLSNKPMSEDMEANAFYYTSIASMMISFLKISKTDAIETIPSALDVCFRGFEADFTQIHCACTSSIKRMLSCSFTLDVVTEVMSNRDSRFAAPFLKSVSVLESLLHLRYQNSWVYSLDCIRSMFTLLNRSANKQFMSKTLENVANVFHACETGTLSHPRPIVQALQDTVGAGLVSFGPVAFLEIVPFRFAEDPTYFGISDSREWVFLILQNYLKRTSCTLADFGNSVLSSAIACSNAVKNPESVGLANDDINAHMLGIIRTRVLQFWSLFPLFCYTGPSDVVATLPRLTKVLEGCLSDSTYPEASMDIINGVSHLVTLAKTKFNVKSLSLSNHTIPPELATLQQSAIVFVPILLKILEDMDITNSQFQSYVNSFSIFISISPSNLVGSVAKKLLQMILSTTNINEESEKQASSWLSMMISIVPFLSDPLVQILYRSIRPFLSLESSLSLQKRSYHVLESLLSTHSEVIFKIDSRQSVVKLIIDSLGSCHISARSMRIRSLESILRTFDDCSEDFLDLVNSILGEMLISLKDVNKRTRDAATDLLYFLIQKIEPNFFFSKLCNGITNSDITIRSASLLAISLLLLKRRGEVDESIIVDVVVPISMLVIDPVTGALSPPEQVRAILTLLKICVAVLSVDAVNLIVTPIIKAFTKDLGADKGKYSVDCRGIIRKLVRKVDADVIRKSLPEEDQPLLNHVLRMSRREMRKKEAIVKKDRLDELLDMGDSDADVDSDREGAGESTHIRKHSNQKQQQLARPKATRVKDFIEDLSKNDSSMMSVDDMLEADSSAMLEKVQQRVSGTKRTNSSSIDRELSATKGDDDDYDITMGEDGQIIIKPKAAAGEKREREDEVGDGKTDSKSYGTKESVSRKRMRVPGQEYKAKKGGGDVWKKGMLQPHAFIPLDPKLLSSKKHRHQALSLMSSVVHTNTSNGGKHSKLRRTQRSSEKRHRAEK